MNGPNRLMAAFLACLLAGCAATPYADWSPPKSPPRTCASLAEAWRLEASWGGDFLPSIEPRMNAMGCAP